MSENGMLRRLEEIEKKYLHIEEILSQPDISPTEIHRYSKQRSEIIEIVETYREYKQTLEEIEKNRTLLADPELGELAKEELGELLQRRSILQEQLRELMLPKDPNDSKNVFLEIRAGTGGEEAALFASDLFRMYSRFAERTGWRVEVMNINETEIGGIKEVIAAIEGSSVYGKLKYESGVHRVQRIPSTEAGGRIHTSTSTVVVIPEPDEMDELDIDERDLRIDTYRASGPGGQHVNKTDSAVRVTHLPTGIVVQCQDERSQHKNRSKCMRMLRAKLFELEEEKRQSEISDLRRSHVGSGDRSEKIRTYNFPQGRITDHRIGLTLHKIEAILDGDLEEITQALNSHYKAKVMNQAPES